MDERYRDQLKELCSAIGENQLPPRVQIAAQLLVNIKLDSEAYPGAFRDNKDRKDSIAAEALSWADALLAAHAETDPSRDREGPVGSI